MRKIIMAITYIIIIILPLIALKYGNTENFALVTTFVVILILLLSYFYFEKSNMGTKEIALIATLSAFAAVSRVPFSAIPNVQPTTFVIAISGYVFGSYQGFLIGSTTAFISNIFLGQGPWTPWQMIAWGIIGAFSGLIGKIKAPIKVEVFALLCFIFGFIFDWIMNLWHIIGFIRPLNIKTIFLAYLSGITFDIMHAFGNFIFAMIFYEKFYKVLNRFKLRLETTYLK